MEGYSQSSRLVNTSRIGLHEIWGEFTQEMHTWHLSIPQILLAIALVFVTHRTTIVFYRLYFHPLSRFPGPKLAACTTLYRAYYQMVCDGEHVAHDTKLHESYGPVVRIAPHTLHFRNPKAFQDMFKFTSKLIKANDFYDHLGQSDALFGLVDEAVHKERFKLVADLFSRKKALEFEGLIVNNANRLCELLLKRIASDDKPVNIARAYRAVALDVVQDFVFDFVPSHLRGMQDESFDTLFVDTTWDVMDWTAWCFRNFPLALTFSNQLPQPLRRILFPGEAANIESFDTIYKLVQANVAVGPNWKRDSLLSRMAGKVTMRQLTAECMGTMFGGVINIANMLPYGAFRVSQNPTLQEEVFRELESIWLDPNDPIPSYNQLSQLPLLKGVVKETLRLMHGIIVGPPRLTPAEGAEIDGYFVPPNVVVTTSSLYCHTNPDVFSEPEKFDPHRWDGNSSEMDKWLVPFSKGKRMCPGKEISIMELFIILALTFRKFKLEPVETTLEDFDWKVYVSLHFKGRFFHANMIPRPGVVVAA
ncbi:cytochrome P450 [Annulohypoxylon maeteangense]|uniref:cytochrome P450 n=1 Tax=Annulohypoxylon maeteangense TaxID=1927788 RepID=UPI002007BBD9|nr:cytochrome P450 [Annulohypoxylon maeteangense]KAI0887003.1 cytochrome P450 [Annulohypoxylon maeteangense]